jgi:hypothetical protein
MAKRRRAKPTGHQPDTRLRLAKGTPAQRQAEEMGAEEMPEMPADRSQRKSGEEIDLERETRGGEREVRNLEHEERVELARSTLAAKREHAEGAGNFPTPQPRPEHFIEPARDRTAKDLRKERDPRSAPKGNVTEGQRERNPELEMRDEFEQERSTPPSGFDIAERATEPEERGKAR